LSVLIDLRKKIAAKEVGRATKMLGYTERDVCCANAFTLLSF